MPKQKRPSDAQLLYNVALCSPLGRMIRELPKEIQQGFRVQLEGLRIIGRGHEKERFVEDFANLSGKLAQSNEIDGVLTHLGGLLDVCENAADPAGYMHFLAQPDLSIGGFLRNIGFFAGDRRVAFEDIPREKQSYGREIIRLAKDNREDSLRKLVEILRAGDREWRDGSGEGRGARDKEDVSAAYQAAAYISKEEEMIDSIFRKDCPEEYYEQSEFVRGRYEDGGLFAWSILPHLGIILVEGEMIPVGKKFKAGDLEVHLAENPDDLLRHNIRGCHYSGSIGVVAKESESVIQHELQHLFDAVVGLVGIDNKPIAQEDEYRAYLASLAFTQETGDLSKTLDDIMETGAQNMINEEFGDDSPSEDGIACSRIVDGLGGLGMEAPADARRGALILLNSAYKEKLGLTYDEIIQPFQKSC